jgi:hypothetical protein
MVLRYVKSQNSADLTDTAADAESHAVFYGVSSNDNVACREKPSNNKAYK